MTRDELNTKYFDWMCQLVCDKRLEKQSYLKLLCYLDSVTFNYTIPMDGNRAEDGIDLRYRFGYENAYEDRMIASHLDFRPCSVLEMMVALAVRCEEDIMYDPDFGVRPDRWFWYMISSLGLDDMTNDNFDESRVEHIITTFINREYKRNGEGGLFTVKNCKCDLRGVEIWYQMCQYLDSIL